MKNALFFLLLIAINGAYAYDESDVRRCEASGGYTKRAACYRGLFGESTCKLGNSRDETNCFRELVSESLGVNLTTTKPQQLPTSPSKPEPRKSLKMDPPVTQSKCHSDLKSFAENELINATAACVMAIERMAKYQFEWTDGWLESKFPLYKWKDNSYCTITYIGDKIKLQNGFGAWANYIYACEYSADTDTVVNVLMEMGRI